ncbi:SIR2L7 [Mytilus edulis]|uniref:Regulatory protein SIR2 homolog 7 n=1 Tax=Mytilus edulis TaxID=6550 RepID=A0A8S3Q9B8_MYTED|nr:SIR2L7 [Mytilus edulis]
MSSDEESDEIEDQEKLEQKVDFTSSRQAKKEARLNQIIFENEHKAKIRKVSKILKKKDHDITDEDKDILTQSPEITNRLVKLKERRGALKQRVLEAASIPDYRGPNGVWTLLQKGQQPKAQDLCDAKPTLTHMSIKKLQDEGHVSHVVSQNCDGLHMRSGLNRRKLSEIHGNMYIEICYSCRPHQEYIRLFDVTEKTGVRRHQTDRNCHTCKQPLKDTIVHFGEKGGMKCPYRWKEAAKAADRCDIILCLGSSLKILKKYSCLWCMDRNKKNRPQLYIINLQWTPRDDAATTKINGRCDDVMRQVMRHLGYSIPEYFEEEDPLFSLATPLHEEENDTTSKKILLKPDIEDITRHRNSVDANRRNSTESERNKNLARLSNTALTDMKTLPSTSVAGSSTNYSVGINTQEKLNTELSVVKSEKYHDQNHFIHSPLDHSLIHHNHALKTALEKNHSENFYRYNAMWAKSPLNPYNPYSLPPYLPGVPNGRQQIKFGEVAFQKYVDQGDNQRKEVKVEPTIDLSTFGGKSPKLENNSVKKNNVNKNCSNSNGKVTLQKDLQKLGSRSKSATVPCKEKCAASPRKSKTNSVLNNEKCSPDVKDDSKIGNSEPITNSTTVTQSSRGRRVRKSFCPNCHGVSGDCPCTVLEPVKKRKPPACGKCEKHPCSCQKSTTPSICLLCRNPLNKCDCKTNILDCPSKCSACGLSKTSCKCQSSKCSVCGLSKTSCKCQSPYKKLMPCQFCRHTPDKCKCALNGQTYLLLCPVCHQHKHLCKCVLNHTSSFTQGANVPNFTNISNLPMAPLMPFFDYAKFAFPMNNISPLYMPQVFQNNLMNGLLPSNYLNAFLPGNSVNPILPSNGLTGFQQDKVLNGTYSARNVNSLVPVNHMTNALKVEPILQDHSYLNKEQMQSLSPNCDKNYQRSQNEKQTIESVTSKTGLKTVESKPTRTGSISPRTSLKRSYSYVDDIQKEEEDIVSQTSPRKIDINHSKIQKKEPVAIKSTEVSNPIVIDIEDETEQGEGEKEGQGDNEKEDQEKPKLMRSMSVPACPGWFGKGLNLRKKRR